MYQYFIFFFFCFQIILYILLYRYILHFVYDDFYVCLVMDFFSVGFVQHSGPYYHINDITWEEKKKSLFLGRITIELSYVNLIIHVTLSQVFNCMKLSTYKLLRRQWSQLGEQFRTISVILLKEREKKIKVLLQGKITIELWSYVYLIIHVTLSEVFLIAWGCLPISHWEDSGPSLVKIKPAELPFESDMEMEPAERNECPPGTNLS